ncbi:HAMP domain-containing histidine kinase [Paenibacillus albicereus]|uniref:histidine kinase n=1 Tax=Paenibacillus albicereus TaxID=2726185 RepID=A0A6H2H1Q4_9BACL|nr:sensor histidine kinase [Paenibacillus albicereus]QJC53278.1 HAMP domain-containing histidine kinase [Paenibacillus albicereus]
MSRSTAAAGGGGSGGRLPRTLRALRLYARGRLAAAAVLALSLGAGSIVWYLERTGTGQRMDWSNLLYFWLLSAAVAAAAFGIGFLRQRSYLDGLLRLVDVPGWRPLQGAATPEQRRTARMLEGLSRMAQDRLQAHDRERELHRHFVYQWVHHMKTPVSVIDLIAQSHAAKAGLGREELRELTDSLREETDRLTRGLEQMLHTARLEEFGLDLHPRRIALHDAAREAVNQHKRLLIAAGVYPRIEGEAWVETDGKWVLFLLVQLIGNAVKYSKLKPGAKRLDIRIGSVADGSAWIEVADEGIGIPAQDVPRVFDPFFTGENGRRSEESTGMGLYLCRQVAGKLGLTLELSSEAGEGTVVRIGFESGAIHRLG